MNVKKQVAYWLKSATDDVQTAQVIFDAGKNYHHCLFFCHLIVEKALKGLVAKHTKQFPPKIHDLEILAKKAGLPLADEQKDFFHLLTRFSLEGRYPDEAFRIYKTANKKVTTELFNKTKETLQWIKELAGQSR